MIYRIAKKNDIERLVGFRRAYMESEYSADARALDEMTGYLAPYFEKHLGNDLFPFIAVDDDGQSVGSLFLIIQEKPASPRFPTGRIGLVLNVFVHRDYRRRGIASALVKQMLDFAKTRELDHIELRATKMGEPLYKGLGFVEDDIYRPMKFYFHD